MSSEEKVPLVPTTSKEPSRGSGNDGYLLLSMPSSENGFVKKLKYVGNHTGLIVGIVAVITIITLIVIITYFADVTELVNRGSSRNPLQQDTPFRTVEISTPLGALKGYVKQSRQGRGYLAFYKVPYAQPPIGQLRFKSPQPAEKWEGLRDFSEVAPDCIQKSKYSTTNEVVGEEDCLYSNIYVPNVANADITSLNFPVMVYVHGGGFGNGNGSRYGADYFMDEDVVLVTFQYRLGLLGFLNTGDREATGNMGFKDQVMLLKWVKAYIQSFGGNPDLVTISGNSSGGFSVSFLVISPMANGIFQRAISQSGTALCEPGTLLDTHPESTRKAVAEAFNCSSENSAELLTCLQTKDAADLVLLRPPDVIHGLTVETGFDPSDLSDVFMPDTPYNLLKSGKVNAVPYLIGVMSTEWIGMSLAMLASDNATALLNRNFHQSAQQFLGMNLTMEESNLMRTFYFDNKAIGVDTERNLTNLVSDRMIVHGSKVVADLHSSVGDTYLFYFKKGAKKSYSASFFEPFPSLDLEEIASHADEIQFLYPYSGYPYIEPSDTKYFPFSEFLVKLWAHFGKTGRVDLNAQTQVWPLVDVNSADKFWFELSDQPKLTNILQTRMEFWDQFSPEKLGYL